MEDHGVKLGDNGSISIRADFLELSHEQWDKLKKRAVAALLPLLTGSSDGNGLQHGTAKALVLLLAHVPRDRVELLVSIREGRDAGRHARFENRVRNRLIE